MQLCPVCGLASHSHHAYWKHLRDEHPEDSAIHTIPLHDLAKHVTNGDPCPCIPRTREGWPIVHNSYDMREVGNVCRAALDQLGGALAEHGHQWSDDLRWNYEHAIQLLDMHWSQIQTERVGYVRRQPPPSEVDSHER